MLPSQGEEVELQLVLVCRQWLGFCFPLWYGWGWITTPRTWLWWQDLSPEQLDTPLPGRAQPWVLVGPLWAPPQGEGFNVQLDQELPRTLHPPALPGPVVGVSPPGR